MTVTQAEAAPLVAMADLRACPKCEKYFHFGFFPRRTSDGRPIGPCMDCIQTAKLLRKIRKSKFKDEDVGAGSGWLRRRASALFAGAQQRSQRLRKPVTITVEWIEKRLHAGYCEVTGIPFDMKRNRGSGNRSSLTPSLDRKEPHLGYTAENCRVVVWMYNAAKGTGTHKDVERLMDAMAACQRAASKESRASCFKRNRKLVPLREKRGR